MVDQQTIIYLNLVFLAIIVIYFWTGRAKDKTSRMNLGGKSAVGERDLKNALQRQGPHHQSERNLGVIFNFNGHQWEAYQVLGLPAGSSVSECQKAHQTFCDLEGSSQLYDLALQAILESKRN